MSLDLVLAANMERFAHLVARIAFTVELDETAHEAIRIERKMEGLMQGILGTDRQSVEEIGGFPV